jgi:hypothetical protein
MSRLAQLVLALLASGSAAFGAEVEAPAGTEPAAAPAADPRVASLLGTPGTDFTVDADGDIQLVYDVGGGRSQLVWISSETTRFGALEIRQVWSLAHRRALPLPADLASRLLEANGGVVLGAWLAQPTETEVGVIFAAQAAAASDATALRTVIHAVATTADALEKDLGGKDEF